MNQEDEKKRILFIEDNPSLRELCAYYFEKAGFQIDAAAMGVDGIKAALESAPDLIVLDIALPDMSGMDVLTRLRLSEGTRNIPVVIITAFESEENRGRAARDGVKKFMIKPVSLMGLLEVVRSALEGQMDTELAP